MANGNDYRCERWSDELSAMQEAILKGKFAVALDLTLHAARHKRNPKRSHITAADLGWGILHPSAQVIEGYPPNPPRQPDERRLICTSGRGGFPLHIVVALLVGGSFGTVTYYDPSQTAELWESDWVTRRRAAGT